MPRVYVQITILVAGIIVFIAGRYWQYNLNRYEFEHRTSGGVVEFRSYWAAKSHRFFKDKGVRYVKSIGILMALFAAFAYWNTNHTAWRRHDADRAGDWRAQQAKAYAAGDERFGSGQQRATDEHCRPALMWDRIHDLPATTCGMTD